MKASNTSKPCPSPPVSPSPSLLPKILHNWALPPTSAYTSLLPSPLQIHTDPKHSPSPLIDALFVLSELTVNNKARAHNLLKTYCLDRNKGKGRKEYHIESEGEGWEGLGGKESVVLETRDVERAIESCRRIIGGLAVERCETPPVESGDEECGSGASLTSFDRETPRGTKRKAGTEALGANTEDGDANTQYDDSRTSSPILTPASLHAASKVPKITEDQMVLPHSTIFAQPHPNCRSSSVSQTASPSDFIYSPEPAGIPISSGTGSSSPPVPDQGDVTSRPPPIRRSSPISQTGSPSGFIYSPHKPSAPGIQDLPPHPNIQPQRTGTPRGLTPILPHVAPAQIPHPQDHLFPPLNQSDPTLPRHTYHPRNYTQEGPTQKYVNPALLQLRPQDQPRCSAPLAPPP